MLQRMMHLNTFSNIPRRLTDYIYTEPVLLFFITNRDCEARGYYGNEAIKSLAIIFTAVAKAYLAP